MPAHRCVPCRRLSDGKGHLRGIQAKPRRLPRRDPHHGRAPGTRRYADGAGHRAGAGRWQGYRSGTASTAAPKHQGTPLGRPAFGEHPFRAGPGGFWATAVLARWRTRPVRFWPWGAPGHIRAGPEAYRATAVLARWRTRPVRFWPWGAPGHFRSGPGAHAHRCSALACHAATTFLGAGATGPDPSGPGSRKASTAPGGSRASRRRHHRRALDARRHPVTNRPCR